MIDRRVASASTAQGDQTLRHVFLHVSLLSLKDGFHGATKHTATVDKDAA